MTVPGSFLGVSTEYWTIPVWARQMGLLHRVLAMLSQDGPIRLRIGGDSADRVQWAPTKELPEWVFELTPSWLRQTSQIVNQTHVKVILDLNLVTSTPALAARWAKTAVARLPQGSITAFEVGNEPDIYSRSAWQRMTAGPGVPPLPSRITATSYARSFASYANALAKVAPGVPLLAPALAEPQKNYGWVTKLLQAPHPGAGRHHRTPLPVLRLCEARLAHIPDDRAGAERERDGRHGPHRVDGRAHQRPGRAAAVADRDQLRHLRRHEGRQQHVRDRAVGARRAVRARPRRRRVGQRPRPADAINMAFSLTRKGLVAHPLFYGMVLFARMLGPGAQLIPLHLAAPAALHLKAWAVRLSDGVMHVLLLDKGGRSARVRLKLPLTGTATIQRLTAPKVTSTGHVTLGNQHLTRAATWAGTPRAETVAPTRNGYLISVPRYSAALVTAQLRPGS